MKKKLLTFLTVSMAILTLAACGEEDTPVTGLDAVQVINGSVVTSTEESVASTEEASQTETSSEPEESEEPSSEENHEGMYRSELTGEWIDEELRNQRPIAAMVDNEITALDHYGVNSADIVYELMNSTENNRVTRLMCVVKDWKNIQQLGSIRSVRTTNFMLAAEYNAVLIHDGGPFYIDEYVARDYCAHLSGGFARFTNGKASEFTEYITYDSYTNPNTGKSYDGLGQRMKSAKISEEYNKYYPGEHFNFPEEGVDLSSASYSTAAKTIQMPHPHNKSKLFYNDDTKTYDYYVYGKAHIDPLDDNNVTTFKNVILQSCSFREYDANGYMIYNVIGSGEGYYITEGYAIPIKWSKTTESGLTSFTDAKTGKEIDLNTGHTYISLIPSDKWNELSIQ